MDTTAQMSASRQAVGLLAWMLTVFAAAAVGGFASAESAGFYQELSRPSWAPPGWLFGPVWTVLYALMGVAAWLVWRVRGFAGVRTALILFIVQLIFNAVWTWIFFVWRQGALAFIEILLLWALIVATLILFWRVSRVAGALMIPYLGWVSFAAALTFAMWRLNPSVLE